MFTTKVDLMQNLARQSNYSSFNFRSLSKWHEYADEIQISNVYSMRVGKEENGEPTVSCKR